MCCIIYCAFHKHANSKVLKAPSQLCFSLPSIIITITSNEPWNTQTHKMDRNPPITNHKPWPFEPVIVKFCFLRGLLKMIDVSEKNAIVKAAFELQNSHVCEKCSYQIKCTTWTPVNVRWLQPEGGNRVRMKRLCLSVLIFQGKVAPRGGTPIHYLYGYVPPKGVMILKLLI